MRAKIEAQKILDYFCVTEPKHIEIEAFCAHFKASVEYKELSGSEGRIMHNGENAVISVSSTITNNQRKRFIIAHELGHYRIHNESRLFLCDKMDFFSWQKENNRETEANMFASEILIPENLFLSQTKGKMVSVNMLLDTADYFNASFTATAYRYASIGNHPIAIVFCHDGIVKWSVINKDFPLKFIQPNLPVHKLSYTSDFFNGETIPTGAEEIPFEAWFRKDYNGVQGITIYEQCFPLKSYNSIISILWMD